MTWTDTLSIARGLSRGVMSDTKFGLNESVGSTFAPITINGLYRTPQPSGAVALRVRAGNANDAPGGTGARSIQITGLNETGELVSEVIATNGNAAGPASTAIFIRLFRVAIAQSGTYATQAAGSHAADIIIEDANGNAWATINATDFPRGQSLIGCITVPLRKKMFVYDLNVTVDAAKNIDLVAFQRQNILQSSAPFSAMRVVEDHPGINGATFRKTYALPISFPPLTDFGYMARYLSGGSTAQVSVTFDYVFVDVD